MSRPSPCVSCSYRVAAPPTKVARATYRLAAALALCLASAGCGLFAPFADLDVAPTPVVQEGLQPDHLVTGSIPASAGRVAPAGLDAEDWRRAKGALALALDPAGDGRLVNWDNPTSGARGSFRPEGRPFLRRDEVCRSFVGQIAGRSRGATPVEGYACRLGAGEWTLKAFGATVKPR